MSLKNFPHIHRRFRTFLSSNDPCNGFLLHFLPFTGFFCFNVQQKSAIPIYPTVLDNVAPFLRHLDEIFPLVFH